MKRKIIIDTDPGVDDGLAIHLAFSSPELEIIGLTTVFGNVSVEQATINALRLVHLADKAHIPVARGASDPLLTPFSGCVSFIHGEHGQENTWHPHSPLKDLKMAAKDF